MLRTVKEKKEDITEVFTAGKKYPITGIVFGGNSFSVFARGNDGDNYVVKSAMGVIFDRLYELSEAGLSFLSEWNGLK